MGIVSFIASPPRSRCAAPRASARRLGRPRGPSAGDAGDRDGTPPIAVAAPAGRRSAGRALLDQPVERQVERLLPAFWSIITLLALPTTD
jgi:hypothetical protein